MTRYQERLQAIVSCVTADIVRSIEQFRPPGPPGTFVLARGFPSRLGRRGNLSLVVHEWFQIGLTSVSGRDRYAIDITGYTYAIHDDSEKEIITWRWHPKQTPEIEHAHLHIGPGALVRREELHRAHLPTGIVTLAEVVRSAIPDFHVEPRQDG